MINYAIYIFLEKENEANNKGTNRSIVPLLT